jgi:hypothetical protein
VIFVVFGMAVSMEIEPSRAVWSVQLSASAGEESARRLVAVSADFNISDLWAFIILSIKKFVRNFHLRDAQAFCRGKKIFMKRGYDSF